MRIKMIFFFLLGMTFLGSCVDKTPLSTDQLVYEGKWMAGDSSWLQIYLNGGGNCTIRKPTESGKGTISKSIEGGKTTITDNKIEIDFLGIMATYNIDKSPFEENGTMKMKLNGLIYEKVN